MKNNKNNVFVLKIPKDIFKWIAITLVVVGFFVGIVYSTREKPISQEEVIIPTPTLTPTITPTITLTPTPIIKIIRIVVTATPAEDKNKKKVEEIDKRISQLKEYLKGQFDIGQKYIDGNISNSPGFQTLMIQIENTKRQISDLEAERRSYE